MSLKGQVLRCHCTGGVSGKGWQVRGGWHICGGRGVTSTWGLMTYIALTGDGGGGQAEDNQRSARACQRQLFFLFSLQPFSKKVFLFLSLSRMSAEPIARTEWPPNEWASHVVSSGCFQFDQLSLLCLCRQDSGLSVYIVCGGQCNCRNITNVLDHSCSPT